VKLAFNIRYLVLGLLVYIAALLINLPADRVYAYWKSSEHSNRGFALSGIGGSIWSGHADVAVLKGHRLEKVKWSLRPWSLLLGRVGLNWRFQLADSQETDANGYGQGVTSLGLGGSVAFSSLQAKLPATLVGSLAKMAALQPSGSVDLNLEDVEWNGEGLVSADGKVVWRAAGVNLLKQMSFGELSLIVETSGDEIKGVLGDSGGPLSAEGLITLGPDGRYQFNGAFASRGDTDLANALRSMGRPGADGKVKINYSGNLARLGILPARSK
jgi:general secretion pathway protein N